MKYYNQKQLYEKMNEIITPYLKTNNGKFVIINYILNYADGSIINFNNKHKQKKYYLHDNHLLYDLESEEPLMFDDLKAASNFLMKNFSLNGTFPQTDGWLEVPYNQNLIDELGEAANRYEGI